MKIDAIKPPPIQARQAAMPAGSAPGLLNAHGNPVRPYERAPHLMIPKQSGHTAAMTTRDWHGWIERASKPGGSIRNHVEARRHGYKDRQRRIASKAQHFQQDNRSEFKREYTLDKDTALRLMIMDPEFFDDESNVKKLIRDNPEVKPWRDTPSRFGGVLESRNKSQHAKPASWKPSAKAA